MQEEHHQRIPIKEGLFVYDEMTGNGYLIGSRCKVCGEYFHPKRVVCLSCYSEELEEIRLSNRGKIVTYTTVMSSYPGAPVKAPFVTAQVELAEKIQLPALIVDATQTDLRIGTPVELCFWSAGKDEQGNELIAYGFRPCMSQTS